ncbi:hypothetical protein GCM10017556_03640 [Micromonospora sagamiensis]|nr:hypothetical protein GCM10017556_03640 [Micromonospora sagamiensis]
MSTREQDRADEGISGPVHAGRPTSTPRAVVGRPVGTAPAHHTRPEASSPSREAENLPDAGGQEARDGVP